MDKLKQSGIWKYRLEIIVLIIAIWSFIAPSVMKFWGNSKEKWQEEYELNAWRKETKDYIELVKENYEYWSKCCETVTKTNNELKTLRDSTNHQFYKQNETFNTILTLIGNLGSSNH